MLLSKLSVSIIIERAFNKRPWLPSIKLLLRKIKISPSNEIGLETKSVLVESYLIRDAVCYRERQRGKKKEEEWSLERKAKIKGRNR